MKTAFLVLGAQRSGTSVTSHMLSKFGIDFGNENHFLKANHNPIFFELNWINHLNNELINALGHHYTDFFLPLRQDFETPDILTDLLTIESELHHQIQDEWNTCPVIGLKDPRFSLTFPVWEKILTPTYQLKIILVFRHPYGFLKSNKKLFYNWEGWTDTRHLEFWLQLNLSAIYFAAPYSIYYLNYDRLINHPLAEAEQLAHCFNFDRHRIAQAASVVDRDCYHNKQAVETGVPEVDRIYQKLCAQALTPTDYLNYRHSKTEGHMYSYTQ